MTNETNTMIDLTNDPVEMNIGDKVFKVQKISYHQLFRNMEPVIKEEYIRDVKLFSDQFTGKEKAEYIKSSIKDIPVGESLIELIVKKLQTIEGIIEILFLALKAYNKITKEDIRNLIETPELDTDISNVIAYATDKDKAENSKEDPLV